MKKLTINFKHKGILSRLKSFRQKIFQLNDSPEKIASGFALGTFIGMTPFIGLQVIISVSLAKILKWNKIAAGIAVFNTNVLTGSFLFGINYLIGSALIGHGQSLTYHLNSGYSLIRVIMGSGQQVFLSFLIGGFITGIPLALLSYILVKGIFRKRLRQLNQ